MNKLRSRLVIALSLMTVVQIFLWSESVLCAAQYIVGYQIHNRAERSLKIQVSSDKRHWQSFTLEPDTTRIFPCGACQFARVATNTDAGTRTVEYRMECGMRYSLEYNHKKGCWDFFKANE
jgi:hypothetical protein